ncbi:hypothetical protein J1N35_028493 [Gossypium stocksii]|uniref:Uncharacterized protein n=1 Tax=Gossypium stocksii TaxID=47602 RepID=A0A9D3UWB0_9ROSI|nr:hypothetical protein J1N35_028493 [Gossypium stocksii]
MASRTVAKDIHTPQQQSIDPEESFAKVKEYGLPQDEGVKSFISNPIAQISGEQSDKEIMREIQAIMTQIASTITYLPCFDEPCKSTI